MEIRRLPFRYFSLITLIGVALALGAASSARAQIAPSIDEMGKKIEPSVVTVKTESGLGSGFVVDPSGLVMTNYHVIEGAKKAVVEFPSDRDKKLYRVEGFMAILINRDLALIKINAGNKKLVALKVADKLPTRGDWVATFGSPLGLALTAADGKISAIRGGSELVDMTKRGPTSIYEELGYDPNSTWLQHTAPISHGNSGGPLVNARAEVVGINTWTLPEGQNLNFAISSPHICAFIAAAPKSVQSLANLPAPREHRPTAPDMGDPVATMNIWTQLNQAKNALQAKLDDSEKKLDQIPTLDPRSLARLQNVRNKRVAKIFKQISKDYADHAAKVKSLKNENADADLIRQVLTEGNAAEKISTFYSELATAALEGGSREAEIAINELKAHLADLRTKYDLLRTNLSRRYGKHFPTLQDTAIDTPPTDTAATKPAGHDGTPAASARAAMRTWTARNGKYRIRAKFLGMEDGKVKLEKADGDVIRVSPSALSQEDRRFIGEE